MQYELGKWLERIEGKIDIILQDVLEQQEMEEEIEDNNDVETEPKRTN